MNEYITYGIFIIYNLILIGGTFFAVKKYKHITSVFNFNTEKLFTEIKNINYTINNVDEIFNKHDMNLLGETVTKLDKFYTDYNVNEFGDKLKWMEKIVEDLDGVDAASKIEEHEEILNDLDIRDINDIISNLASEEYVNQEIEDLHTYINEQSDRIDYLEKIFGAFRNVLNEKDEF